MESQKERLVNINLDGASVNMGIYNGVAARLQTRLGPHVTKIHCINHQLELAILDLRKDNSYLGIFESTLKVSLVPNLWVKVSLKLDNDLYIFFLIFILIYYTKINGIIIK